MEKIIDPVPVELIKAELTPDKKLCDTNKADNEIYVVDWRDAPNVLREIGRLREISFREAGGCSGKSMDLDEFDFMEKPYRQMIIWDPENEVIIGGYRYIVGTDVTFGEDGQPHLATAELFRFSDNFIKNYLPHTIELGRSFVVPTYQSSKAGAKAIFALDNLWDGLAAIMMLHLQCFYYFGKMTIHPDYDRTCCDLLEHFLWKHFPDVDELVRPIEPVLPATDGRLFDFILTEEDFKQDYRCLKNAVRRLGSSIPPLVNSYMNTSPTMKMFGSAKCKDLIGAQEMGILVCFNEMYEDKRDRHMEPFLKTLASKMRRRNRHIEEEEIVKPLRERKWKRRVQAFNAFLRRHGRKQQQ